ncbi:hypothetical protein MicloDRAFT_00005560 [Microvirga lotononidis]|uniref:Uncharacterized protein n=1 Tax=Microvirga lotononidis TaxID=864069 RepID=I4Z361_9HYPH|nr:hypothetical protein MicloDRAFT_00005560 [Microvirga lotononidis]
MSLPSLHPCGCPKCHSRKPHPDRMLHRQINLLASRLDEQQRRWFIAFEAMRIGWGGTQRLAQITGLTPPYHPARPSRTRGRAC